MEHDFCDFQGCVNSATSRVSADGSNCTGVQGFMDYFPIRNIWTKCSDEDYQRYIERIGGSCLPEQCPAQKPVVPVDLGPNSPCFNACGGTACGDPMFCKNLKEADEGCQSPDASILCRKTCNKCSKTQIVLPPRQIKSTVRLCRRIKSRRRQIQTFDLNNN